VIKSHVEISLSKVCNIQDFDTLAPLISQLKRGVFQDTFYRKYWEEAQAIRTLTPLPESSIVLGVGAGYEAPLFYFTRHFKQVHATDIYLTPGWDEYAPAEFVRNPDKYAPFAYDRQRLIVQHMDARDLRYPDGYFDGVFSSSSIEHFGTPDEIAQAVSEMARVTKRGGLIALTTEFAVGGKSGAINGNTFIFNASTLRKYVIDAAAGCELTTPIDFAVSAETLATVIDFYEMMRLSKTHSIPTPHIVIDWDGFVFAPISLVFRKVG
jgi:SAM-dependent methyltransferase